MSLTFSHDLENYLKVILKKKQEFRNSRDRELNCRTGIKMEQ